jgi:hypothetical protein
VVEGCERGRHAGYHGVVESCGAGALPLTANGIPETTFHTTYGGKDESVRRAKPCTHAALRKSRALRRAFLSLENHSLRRTTTPGQPPLPHPSAPTILPPSPTTTPRCPASTPRPRPSPTTPRCPAPAPFPCPISLPLPLCPPPPPLSLPPSPSAPTGAAAASSRLTRHAECLHRLPQDVEAEVGHLRRGVALAVAPYLLPHLGVVAAAGLDATLRGGYGGGREGQLGVAGAGCAIWLVVSDVRTPAE